MPADERVELPLTHTPPVGLSDPDSMHPNAS
jgi:hypothetical protein